MNYTIIEHDNIPIGFFRNQEEAEQALRYTDGIISTREIPKRDVVNE